MQRSTNNFSSLRASTLKIEAVETFVVDLPIIRPHLLSVATMQAQTLMIVKVICSDGITGLGEGTTIGGLSYGAESPEGMKLAIDQYIAPILKSANPARVPETMIAIRKAIKGNNFAKCAVETALLDAWGKRVGLPMSELVGGRLRDRLPVAWTLASGDTAVDIAEAEQMLERKRHNTFKLKIGRRSIDEDVAHVAAVKRALGNTASVRVDVNMAWGEVEANKGLAALEAAGCDLAEQPVESPAALARLAARFAIPIMADESLQGPETAFALARASAADVFAVKIAQSGGLYQAGRVGAIADAASIGLYGGTMLEGAIGTIASAHLFSTFPNLTWGTELFGPLLLAQELVTEPLQYQDFELVVPTGLGLGVELDDERLRFFRRDAERRKISTASAQTGC
ncbi:MAG TPA: muconate/chloromuconate family cycloisomerase [Stellaceae bacterium]|nr:muconate/chloromuconate family cycloisomerase [Stellaceae bacterium]